MDERDGFLFYKSFYDVVKALPQRDQKRMLVAIIELGLTDTIDETLPTWMKATLIQIQATINAAQKRRKIGHENGKKGGAPRGNQNAAKKNNQLVDSKQPKEKEKENGKGNAKANTFSIRKGNNTSSGMASPNGGQPSDDDESDWEEP